MAKNKDKKRIKRLKRRLKEEEDKKQVKEALSGKMQ
jgi:hypothetical protein